MSATTPQQELATAIARVITPMIKTGEGISDAPVWEFASDHAGQILADLDEQFALRNLTKAES